MHETLIQQLIEYFGSPENVPEEFKPFLEEVNRTYMNGELAAAAKAVAMQKAGKKPRQTAQLRPDSPENGDNAHGSSGDIAIPIQLRGQTLGAINLSFDDTDSASATAPLIQQISSRLALAMDNARLFQETQAALSRTNALLEVSRAAVAFESTTHLLETASEIIARTLNSDRIVIRQMDPDKEVILEAVGSGPGVHHSPLDLPFKDLMDGLHGWVLRERKPANSAKDKPDPRDSEKTRNLRILANCGAIMVVPLIIRDKVNGMITAINTPVQPNFTDQDAELLLAMANQIATALENASLVEEQQRRLQELSILFEGSRIFSTVPTDLVHASETIGRYFVETADSSTASVGFYIPEEDYIRFYAEIKNDLGIISIGENPDQWNYALDNYPFTRSVLEKREAAVVSLRDPGIDPAEKAFLDENKIQALVIIPLASKGQTIGVIELEYDEPTLLTQQQLEYFTTLANQAAATLDNLQLLQVQQQRALELQTAAEVSRAASSILDPEELLPRTVELIQERFNLYYAGIFLVDDRNEWAVLQAGSGEAGRIQIEQNHRLQIGGQSMIGRCVATGEPQISFDLGAGPEAYFKNPVLPDTRSEMALPLISRGRRIGAMTIQSTEPAAFSDENITTLQTMADQLANAIENARLFAQAQLQNDELDTLNEMGRALTARLNRESIVEAIYEYTTQLMEFNSVLLAFYDQETKRLTFPLVVEDTKRLTIADQGLGSGLIAHIIKTREPLLVAENLAEEAKKLNIKYKTVGEPPASWLGVPMFLGNEVVGVISVQSTTTSRLYTERSRDLLISIANQASNALQITTLFEQAQQQADDLSVLNEMSRALSIQLDIDTVVENIHTYTSRLLQTSNMFIMLFDEATEMIEFRLVSADDGTRVRVPPRKLGSGLLDYVIRHKTSLLLRDNAAEEIEKMGLEGINLGDVPLSWLGVPIVLGDSVIGMIGTQNVSTASKYTERHRNLLISAAGQAAIALQNTNLFRQAQQQSEDLAVLNEMSRELSTLLDPDWIVESVYQYAARLIGTKNIFIALYNNETDLISFPYVVDDGKKIQIPDRVMGEGLTDHVIKTRTPLIINEDAETVLNEMGLDSILVGDPPESWIGIPIVLGNQSLGMIGSQSVRVPRRYSQRHIGLITSIAGQAAITLQNAALFNQSQQQNEELLVLNEMSQALAVQTDINEIVDVVYAHTARLVDPSNFFMAFFNAETRMLTFPLATIGSKGERIDVAPRPLQNGLTDYIIKSKEPLLITTFDEAHYEELGVDMMTFGDDKVAQSWLGVPMLSGGSVLGVISLQSTEKPRMYSERHRDLLTAIANQAVSAIQNARSFSQAQRQAEELAILNEMSRELTTLLDVQKVVERIFDYTSKLMDTTSFLVAFFDAEAEQVNLPLVYSAGRRIEDMPPRSLGNGLTDYVLRSESPLLFSTFSLDELEKRGLELILFGDDKLPKSWLGVPMLIGGTIMGAIVVQSVSTAGMFQERHRDLLISVANQAANAIQNARLFVQTQRQNHDLAVLNEMSRVLAGTLSVDEVFENVYRYASQVLDTTIFHATLYDAEFETIRYPLVVNQGQQIEVPTRPLGNRGLTEYIINRREAILLKENVLEEIKSRGLEIVFLGDEQVPMSWLGVPMTIGPEVIGTLSVQSTLVSRLFGEYERDLLISIAGQAAIAIQNARLFGETQKRAGQLLTAAEVAREASESLNLDELLPRAVELIRERFGFYHASIFLLDEARKSAYVRASTGDAGREMITRRHNLAVGSQSIIGSVTLKGEPLLINDVTNDIIHRPNPLLPDTRAELGIPLKVGDRVIGALDVQSTETNAFTNDDISVLQTLADQIAVAVDNSRTYELAAMASREASDRAAQMTSLYNVSRELTSSALETREVVETALRSISSQMGEMITCSISIIDPETGAMRTIADQVLEDGKRTFSETAEQWSFRLEEFPATRTVVETLRPRLFNRTDPTIDPKERAYMEQAGSHALLIVPLTVKGEALGVLEIETWDPETRITPEQINLLSAMANQTASALENALLYDEQIKTAEQLRELDKLKNQFLANMSHELRTPLNSIIGFSRVILKGIDGPVSDLQQQDLTAIYNAGQHLLGLINDILDLSRIEAGKMELNFEDLQIESLISSVMATARGLVKEKKIMLEQRVQPNLPIIQADATRIRQVLLNLLQNAAKFTEEGHIRVLATLESAPSGQVIKISVEDTGIGIAMEDQERLFQPFTQVDSSTTRKVGGTGLGLSISRNLIDLHGGEIGVRSTVGKGSTFYFTLPLKIETPKIEYDGERKLVLAIDDDPNVVELYERYLNSQGFEVIPVHDPNRAVELAIELKPFAITLDVMMPSKNGWQVMQDLKAHDATRNIPVIFCTIIEEKTRGFRLGASDYLLKPILEEDLVNALVRLEAVNEIHTVLVIDDDSEVLRLVEKILKPTGLYDLILAEGGEMGMIALKKYNPDVILLDLLMDDLDGFKVLEHIHQHEKLSQIPVIVVTGYELDEVEHETISAYASNLIRKGNFKEKQLIDKIAEILKERNRPGNKSELN